MSNLDNLDEESFEEVYGDPVFENDRYVVHIGSFPGLVEQHGAHYDHGYIVINKDTGVFEVYTPNYPDAVAAAEQLDIAIANSVWKWIRINHEAQAMEEADDEPEVH